MRNTSKIFERGFSVEETETTLWERPLMEQSASEVRTLPPSHTRAAVAMRTYRRKLPLQTANKRIINSTRPIDSPQDPNSSPNNAQLLIQEHLTEKLVNGIAQRYNEGRIARQPRPDSINNQSKSSRYHAPPLFNFASSGPWYGNYVGPDAAQGYRAGERYAPEPATPVDRSAMEHDLDYYSIQDKHGFYPSDPMTGWLEGFYSLDSGLQFDLGVADSKLAIRAPLYFIKGIFDGSYGLDNFSSDERHKAFASDLVWAVGISSTHVVLALHRFGMAGLGLILEGGHEVSRGIIRFGKSVGGIGGGIIQGIGYATDFIISGAIELARFAWSVGAAALGIGVAIYNLVFSPFLYVAAYIGAKVVSAIVSIGKAIWEGIKSIGDAIGDFFDSIFMLSEAARLSVGADTSVRDTMSHFRDTYVRQIDIDGKFLSDYYTSGPLIVAAIEQRDDALDIWSTSYHRWVQPSIECIRRGDESHALSYIREMYQELAMMSGIEIGQDQVARHWKRPLVTT